MAYISPCRRGSCSACGATIQITRSSAAEPKCMPCRRGYCHWPPDAQPKPKASLKKTRPSGCLKCGAAKPSALHWYCTPCGELARKRSNRGGPKLPVDQRGYGPEHRRARRAAIAAHRPDDPCARCDAPLGEDTSVLDLDHTDDRTGYLGLSHRSCNRSARGADALVK